MVVKISRVVAFLAVLAAFTATFQAGSMSDVTQAEADLFVSEFEKLVEGIDAFGIFMHNTLIALPMFIPGFGLVWGFVSAWTTGFAFAALSVTMPELGGILPVSLLFLTPFGLMEVAAYSLAMSRSLLIVITIVQRAGMAGHVRPTLVEVGVVVALLLAGGYVEFYIIQQAEEIMAGRPAPGI